MATKQHWEVDPWDEKAMWLKVIAREAEDAQENLITAERIFGPHVGVRCLEIGAGVGRLLKFASTRYFQAWGVDSSASLVAMSTRYLQNFEQARVVLGDGINLPFKDNHFSFVYSFTCFQHMETLETIQANLHEAYRVIFPQGTLRVQTVCGERSSGLFDGYVFESAEEFAYEFFAAGFGHVHAEQIGPWIWVTATKVPRVN